MNGVVSWVRVDQNAAAPYKSPNDNSMVLCSCEQVDVPANGKVAVRTGLTIAVPQGCRGRLETHPQHAVAQVISVDPQEISENYNEEIRVTLVNAR